MSRSGSIVPPPVPQRKTRDGVADLRCPACGRGARIPVRFAGRRVRCPKCAAEYRLADDASRLIEIVATTPPVPKQTPIPKQTPRSSPPAIAEPAGGRKRWLLAGWAAGLLVAGSVAAILIADRDTAANYENDDAKTATVDRPAAGNVADKPAAVPNAPEKRAAVENDPPKPAETDGDKLVQIDAFDEKRLQGLKVALPALALKEKSSIDANGTALFDVLKRMAEHHRIPIVVDGKALDDEGIPLKKWPVTVAVKDVPLSEAFDAVLGPIQLKLVLPAPDAKAVVITSEVKAAGIDANALIRNGTLVAGKTPATSPPANPPARTTRPKRKGKTPARKGTAQSRVRRGRQLLGQRKLDEAIAEFNRALQIRRNNVEALYGRGYAFLLKNDNRKAIADFSAVIRLRKNHAAAYTSRAVAYTRLGKRESARADRVIAARLRGRKK